MMPLLRHLHRILTAILLCGLVAAGTVPQGLMRAEGGGGIVMEICGTDGAPRFIRVDQDDNEKPDDGSGRTAQHGSQCLQIALALPTPMWEQCPALQGQARCFVPVVAPRQTPILRSTWTAPPTRGPPVIL